MSDMIESESVVVSPIVKLTKDLRNASITLGDDEARFLVDAYYQMQHNRLAADGQIRSIKAEPHAVLGWLSDQNSGLENQIKAALGVYAKNHIAGPWLFGVTGIGPVISAGLLAHIDIEQATTVGHIWRFAGLDPTMKWTGREEAKAMVEEIETIDESTIAEIALKLGHKLENFSKAVRLFSTDKKTGQPKTVTKAVIGKAISRRPWNASLKTLCWKIGESFVKVCNHPDAYYGRVYVERKAQETARNEALKFSDQAASILASKRIGKDTDAYKAYSVGKLPPAHIHARAKRYAVKLFLAHLHEVWYTAHFGEPPPKPYPIAVLGHAHYLPPPK